MKKKILLFGAGLVGRAMAIDLNQSGHDVVVVDADAAVLDELAAGHGIRGLCADFFSDEADALLKDADLVMGAAPGAVGLRLMERVIRAGKDMVDISFCPEDFLELDGLAQQRGVTVVADMGVAPGMCNALLGYHEARMKVDSYRCLVGGLPFEREWPLEYKSSWSPMDCIEEYVRPARLREGGRDVTKPALSDLEKVEFEKVGTLEAWNSDGLRSLLKSYPHIPDMVEKTLRYPGTVDYLRVLRELGFFRFDEVEVAGHQIRPVDLSAALLFPRFELEKGEGEFTLMQVEISGEEGGKPAHYLYELFDEYDVGSDTLSMARCTGYTATGVAGLILDGLLEENGVLAPEKAAEKEESMRALLSHLEARKVVYTKTIKNQSK